MTDAQGQERRPIVRWRRRAVVFLLVVAGVFVVRAIADVMLGRSLSAEIARLEERFGPLRWDSVRKVHPWKTWPRRIAPNNRARLIDAAAARITVATDEHVDLLYAVNTQAATMSAGQVREIAEGNRDAVELAIRAAHLPHSNWGIGCCGGVPSLMVDVRFLSTVLAITARGDTDAGRADAAAADVMAGFAIATAMSNEPDPLMLLLAARTAYVHDVALKNLLNRAEPPAPVLTELARVIDEGLGAPPARTALLGLLKGAGAKWPRVERGWFFTSEDGYPTRPSTWTRGIAWLARPGIRYRALRDLADKGRAVDAASMTRAERVGIASSLRPPAPGLIDVGDQWSVILGNAATAVALRRFKIDRGAYPARLDELVPGYLKAVPIDPYAGNPPEYVRSGSGFELRTPAPQQEHRNWNITR